MDWTRLTTQIAAVAAMLREEHRRNTREWIRRFEPSTTT
jgi:hypothetical protein